MCAYEGVKNVRFSKNFGVLCFLEIPVLRFALLPYYRRNMTFSSFEQNGWKLCDDTLIMVPVLFTGSQLPPTVMKRIHEVKVTKKDVYFSNDNLTDDEENVTEPKRKREQKLITLNPSSESDDSSTTKLNWINTFGKKRLIVKVTMKMKMFKCQKTVIQVITKTTGKFLAFFLVKILVMNGYLKSYKTKCFIYKQPSKGVPQK